MYVIGKFLSRHNQTAYWYFQGLTKVTSLLSPNLDLAQLCRKCLYYAVHTYPTFACVRCECYNLVWRPLPSLYICNITTTNTAPCDKYPNHISLTFRRTSAPSANDVMH